MVGEDEKWEGQKVLNGRWKGRWRRGRRSRGGEEIRMVRSFSSIVLQQAKVRSITICMY